MRCSNRTEDPSAMPRPVPARNPDAVRSPLDVGAVPGGAELPVWDLGDLYRSPEDPALAADLHAAEAEAQAFAARHAGKLGGMDGAALAAAIAEYERIEERLGKAMSYGQLVFSGDAQDPANGRFYQTLQERVTAISSHLLFFTLELNRLEDAELERKYAGGALERWRPWLRDLRVFRPHQLSDEAEKLLHEKEVTGRSAWNRLFDETVAGMTVPVGGEELTVSAALNRLTDRDRSVREAAAKGVSRPSGAACGCSRSSPTRSPRTRRSSTPGGATRAGLRAQPREHGGGRGGGRAWSPPWWRASRACRTATTL
jgi:oligoendopeptidase F